MYSFQLVFLSNLVTAVYVVLPPKPWLYFLFCGYTTRSSPHVSTSHQKDPEVVMCPCHGYTSHVVDMLGYMLHLYRQATA